MREIKFRAWHSIQCKMFSAEEMAVDQLTLLTTGQFINVSSADPSRSQIDHKGVMVPLQYTGLKGKDEKEIYHGDILSDTKTIYLVEWHRQQACWWLSAKVSLCGEDWLVLLANNQGLGNGYSSRNDLAVVGNIYEHPHLLSEQSPAIK